MQIRLVSHASMVITCNDVGIWTDPWTIGKAFNDSWSLWPPAVPPDLAHINYIWISHEHPDHLNFPTLAKLPADFRKRVTILYQLRDATRIFRALQPLGFQCFRMLPHREITRLAAGCYVYSYEVGTIDSCLAVISQGQTVMNLNDARLNSTDYLRILDDIGLIDVLLNQFSLAVKDPIVDFASRARGAARQVLQSMVNDHQGLSANVTIPFASLMYFSTTDNAHLNAFRNTPHDAYEYGTQRGCEFVVLYPGDEYEVGEAHSAIAALARYAVADYDLRDQPLTTPPMIAVDELARAAQDLVANLYGRYPTWLLRRFPPLYIRIPDLACVLALDLAAGELHAAPVGVEPDAEIYSQPLYYALEETWGWATLSSSGRFTLLRHSTKWRIYKALFALYNAGVFIHPWHWRKSLEYFRCRANLWRRYQERTGY